MNSNPERDDLHQAAQKIRTLLLAEVSALIARGLVPSKALLDYGGRAEFGNVARDLTLLASVIRAAAPAVQDGCMVDEQQLEALGKLCDYACGMESDA
jgi:hypothetical protein